MWYSRYGKRAFDLLLVVVVLVCFWWAFILLWFACLLFIKSPVLFRQSRIGKDNLPFVLLKLRTLTSDENDALRDRVSVFGRFLRFTSLDELPQLWNIVKGEMSWVGPRPLPEEYLPLYSSEQRRRHEVLPGITGWAQVNGRSTLPWGKKFELDGYYVDNVSFFLDGNILLKTLRLLLSFKKDVSLEEQKFTGS